METLDLILALNDATKILKEANRQCTGDSFTIWRLTDHAEQHIDKQIRALLAPAPESYTCICGAPADGFEIEPCASCGMRGGVHAL